VGKLADRVKKKLEDSGEIMSSGTDIGDFEVWHETGRVPLFTPTGAPLVYTVSNIPEGNAENCVRKQVGGKRVFWRQTELPPGWRLRGKEDYPYECRLWVEGCPKRLLSVQALLLHIRARHPAIYEFVKDDLGKLLQKEGMASEQDRMQIRHVPQMEQVSA
jgi:hypothetical protein